mmetsp:Transcript_40139/g.103906  ORF Transcript_40139/g.103906 Transcript_40139/m.103906 type:complete len:491 (-) Transcript_40139:175-1647(-)
MTPTPPMSCTVASFPPAAGGQGSPATPVPYQDLLVKRQDQWSNFPAGLRVLVADNDPASLQQVEKMLKKCSYQVTLCSSGKNSLEILRKRREEFDLVLADANLPDIDGFKLLHVCHTELSLPVVLMSGTSDTQLVMRGVMDGARDFLIKPLRVEELKVLWQHLVRFTSEITKTDAQLNVVKVELDGGRPAGEVSTSQNGSQCTEREGEGNSSKKQRMNWSDEMHQQFVNAVNQLGIDKAVPKRILDLMSVEGLTRENVASHLQKYRIYLKRMANHQENGKQAVMSTDTIARAEAAYQGGMPQGQQMMQQEHSGQAVQYSQPHAPGGLHQQAMPAQMHMGMMPAGPQPGSMQMAPHHVMQMPNGQVMVMQQMGPRPGMPPGMPQQMMASSQQMGMLQPGMPAGQMLHFQHPQQVHQHPPSSGPMHAGGEMIDPGSMQRLHQQPHYIGPNGQHMPAPAMGMPSGTVQHMEYAYSQPMQMAGWPVQGQPGNQA